MIDCALSSVYHLLNGLSKIKSTDPLLK